MNTGLRRGLRTGDPPRARGRTTGDSPGEWRRLLRLREKSLTLQLGDVGLEHLDHILLKAGALECGSAFQLLGQVGGHVANVQDFAR